jgi:hypothetical protein
MRGVEPARMKRLIAALVASMTCLAMVLGIEPSYRKELPFTPKPIALNEPISCVPDTRVDIAFLDDPARGKSFSACSVEKEAIPHPLRIAVLGKKADVISLSASGLLHLWYQVVRRNGWIVVLSGDEATAHAMITIDVKRGAFVYTAAYSVGGKVHVTSLRGRCQND